MKPGDIARLGREEHEEREGRRQKIRRLRKHKKASRIPRTIREQRAAEKGQAARQFLPGEKPKERDESVLRP